MSLLALASNAGAQQSPHDAEVARLLDAFLAQRVPGRAAPQIRRLRELGLAAVEPLGRILADRHAEGRRRSWTAYLLRRVGRVEAVPHLVDALRDPDWRVRKNAANALGALGRRAAIAELLPLLVDPVHSVRLSAGGAINKLAAPEFLPHLVEAYRGCRDDQARATLVALIGQLEDRAAAGPLAAALRDTAPRCRSHAAYYLAALAPERLRPRLPRLLADPEREVRSMALRLLPLLGPPLPVAAVLRLLDDADRAVRDAAAGALAFLPGAPARFALMAALVRERDAEVRLALASALGKSRPLSALAELAAAAGDRTLPEGLRARALYALSRLRLPAAIETLIATLDSPSPLLRAIASEQLREATGREAPAGDPALQQRELARWWRGARRGFVFPAGGKRTAPGMMQRWRSRHYRLQTDVDAPLAERILLVMERMHDAYERRYDPPPSLLDQPAELLQALGARREACSAGLRFRLPDGRLLLHGEQRRELLRPDGMLLSIEPGGTRRVRLPWGRQVTRWPRRLPARPTRIQLFWRRRGYREYARIADARWPFLQDAGGYFSPTRQEIVTYSKPARDAVFNTLRHEAQHQVLSRHLRKAPVWLNEGLSEYHEQSRFDGDRLIHEPHRPHLRFLARLLQEQSQLPLRALVGLDYNAFHADSFGPVEIGNYAQSWSLVYFLLEAEGGRYRGLFEQCFEALRAGASSEPALQHYLARHGLSWETLERRWAAYFLALARKQAETPRPHGGR